MPQELPPIELRLRAVADVLGGFDGGQAFARAALAGVDQAVERARDRAEGFSSWPRGWFDRLLGDVGDALRLAAIAVVVQELLNEEELDDPSAALADVLLRRAQEARGESTELYAAGARALEYNLDLARQAKIGPNSAARPPRRASSPRGRRSQREP